MKYFDWDAGKDEKLKKERGVGFEDVLVSIEEKGVLDVYDHPNQKRYPGQKIIVVEIESYAYLVPYTEDEEKYFLKTIIPSRKATKKHIIKSK
jgi:uncharacterized DUF497 family protein